MSEKTVTPTCKRKECVRKLLPAAVAVGDPYCSADCCRLAYSVVFDSERAQRKTRRASIKKDGKLICPEHKEPKNKFRKCDSCERERSRRYRSTPEGKQYEREYKARRRAAGLDRESDKRQNERRRAARQAKRAA